MKGKKDEDRCNFDGVDQKTEIMPGYKRFRLSRREDDFCVENSFDGIDFKQMRICHMFNTPKEISFGIYACSAEDSSFLATFTDMKMTDCAWKAHDGQQPD